MKKTLIRGGTLINEGVETRESCVSTTTDILIGLNGTIEAINPSIQDHRDADVIDASGKLLFPLLIDSHVHFREPGLEQKATMATETAAALAGGIGTACEMPNTVPPTVTIAALADKVRRSEGIQGFTMKFFFGITETAHLLTLKELWTGASYELKRLKNHCCGVKLYLDHSTGDQKVDGGIVEEVFRTCAELGIPLVAHCEDAEMNTKAKLEVETKNFASLHDVSLHSKIRPPESEAASIQYAINMARRTGAALHIAHLSTMQGIELVRAAKKEKLPVTCEVAPHHLFLTTDDYASLGTFAKMNPPLRSSEHRDALWAGIADGTVDCIATDHAPHTVEEKKCNEPLSAPSGVPGVETMLPLLLTVAAGKWPHPHSGQPAQEKPLLAYADILRLCFINPNRIFSLHQESIAQGKSPRLMLIDQRKSWTIRNADQKTKCGWTPFDGWKVTGKITPQ